MLEQIIVLKGSFGTIKLLKKTSKISFKQNENIVTTIKRSAVRVTGQKPTDIKRRI